MSSFNRLKLFIKKLSSGLKFPGSRFIVISICMLLVVSLNYQCGAPSDSYEEELTAYASLDSTTGYVGMETCRDCHQSIYDSYIHTGMGMSFDKASQTKSSAEFSAHHKVYDEYLNFWYYPYWDNDSLRILEYRLDGKDTIHKRIETITYIIGSGQHTNSHIMNTAGYLNQIPLTFYTQKGQWDLPPGYEKGGNTRFNRLIGLECMSCHNAYPEFEPGSENKYSFVDNGIDCERCHGPGEVHVNEKRAGIVTDVVTGIDYSIVNPAKLPIDLQLDVCQRCHIQGNAVLNDDKSFFDFKPGMRLSDIMNVFMPVYRNSENEHIMASHVERMKLSKCFTESIKRAEKNPVDELRPYKNALTCITCHNPHVSVVTTNKDHFNLACNNCHSSAKDGLCAEKTEILKLKNYDCVSCHMPASGTIDIPHVSVHDHHIRIPVKDDEIEKIREFVGINCINNPEAEGKAVGKAFIAYFEKFNYGKEVLDSARKYFPDKTVDEIKNNFKHLVHISFLEKDYRKVVAYTKSNSGVAQTLNKISFNNEDAWTAYRIGASYLETGDAVACEQYYAIAYKLAPLHPDFANKYATILVSNKKLDEAKRILEKTVAEYPKFPPALSNLGYLTLVRDGDVEKANQLYDRALALDPDYDQAIMNKAGILMHTGKNKDAILLLKRFLKFNPGHMGAANLLKQISEI